MAKVITRKAQKDYTCSKCNKTIAAGTEYYKVKKMYSKPLHICTTCGVRESDKTSSDKLQRVYGALEDLQDWLKSTDLDLEKLSVLLESASSTAEEVASEYNDAADGVSDRFGETSKVEEMREKSEALENWQSEIESVSEDLERPSSKEEFDRLIKDIKQRVEEVIASLEL